MKPGFVLWLITFLSFVWGISFGFIAYNAAADTTKTGKAVVPAVAAELFSSFGLAVCAICLLIRFSQVI